MRRDPYKLGAVAVEAAIDQTKATVREWHPKCETCRRREGLYCNLWQHGIPWRPDQGGCLANTDFDKEDET